MDRADEFAMVELKMVEGRELPSLMKDGVV
jgi:hypothetical protein